MKSILIRAIGALSIVFLVSCASTPSIEKFSSTADPSQEIGNLESDLQSAKEQQVDALAKDDFKRAHKQLSKAVEARNDGKDNEKILDEVAEGKAWLRQAIEKSNTSRESLSEIISVRQRALERGAAQHAKKELAKADKDLESMSADIQDKDRIREKDRRELLRQYLSIELIATRNAALETARRNVAQAEKEGAEDYAPQTLSLVKANINELDNYITANKDNTTGIQERKTALDRRSNYLVTITREAKRNNNKSAEQLAIEGNMQTAEQRRLSRELATTQTDLSDTTLALTSAITEKDKLAVDAEVKRKYEETKDKFSNSEAEVYLEGSNILIRLKGLNFASGKANLTKNNSALLAKVDEAIQEIGNSTIKVEGHTDSTGSKATNQELSAARAKTVENFLVNKGTIDEAKIQAEGYGDTRPLATNKTKDGRAQNRRVDIVISPL